MDYKVIIGVGLIAAGGYLLWKENQKKEMLGIDGFTTRVIGDRSKRGFVSSLPAQSSNFFKSFAASNLPAVTSPFDVLAKKSFAADNMNIVSSNWM
jgi:hypothetical protein